MVTKYLGRHLDRPVIAASRIDSYDGANVTIHYNRHEDNKYVTETLPALVFIERLIQHIPEKHFKMIRYGGIYARNRDIDKYCFGQFPVKSIISCTAIINGVLSSSMVSAMTPSDAMNVTPICSFWNCIIGTSVFLLKKCTRKPCPVPVERSLLHSFQIIPYGI